MLLASAVYGAAALHTSERLRVEYLENPLGIDEPLPRFSFAPVHSDREQTLTSCRVVVWALPQQQVVWDSDFTILSSLNIEYAGSPLAADSDFVWGVWWKNTSGAVSAPVNASFSTALFSPSDWRGAEWLDVAAVGGIAQADFTLPSAPSRARLHVSGLGAYHAWANGRQVDSAAGAYGATWSVFERRVVYDSVDIAAALAAGCNTLSLSLGAGWAADPSVAVGAPRAIVHLSVAFPDGTPPMVFVSGASPAAGATALSFLAAAGPVVRNNQYDGEEYDARLVPPGWLRCGGATPAGGWREVAPLRPQPAAVLSAQAVWVRVAAEYPALSVSAPQDGVFVFDFGQNMAGSVRMRGAADAGTTVAMAFGELLHPDGTVWNHYGDENRMVARYTFAGADGGEEYTPQFVTFGFRYCQVTGLATPPGADFLTALFVHGAVAEVGSVTAGPHPAFQEISRLTRMAGLSNLMDIPTDCPQRERRGWLGDAQLTAEGHIHAYDMAAFYTKWLRDIADTQAMYNATHQGQIPDCVPYYGHGSIPADPAWSAALPLLTRWVAGYYDDSRIAARMYYTVRAYADSQLAQAAATGGILTWHLYGDWCSAATGLQQGCSFTTDSISTYYMLESLDTVAALATQLGLADDAAKYAALANTTRALYQRAFYRGDAMEYDRGFAIEQLVALAAGVVPPAARAAVVAALLRNVTTGAIFPYHNAGGIIQSKLLFPALSDEGLHSAATRVFVASGQPSYSWFTAQGATTLWENWQSTAQRPAGSLNHIMYGGHASWVYTHVAGIQRAGGKSWRHLALRAVPTADVRFASAAIRTPLGLVSHSWAVGSGDICAAVSEGGSTQLTCQGGVFTNVTFASYGTPTGACGNYTVDPLCDAPTSVQVVAAACVGKAACTLVASNDAFGGDPCVGTSKRLYAELAGTCAAPFFSSSATIPVGPVAATVTMPLLRHAAVSVVATEGGTPFFSQGRYVPGVPGVVAAQVVSDGAELKVVVRSGVFHFQLFAS